LGATSGSRSLKIIIIKVKQEWVQVECRPGKIILEEISNQEQGKNSDPLVFCENFIFKIIVNFFSKEINFILLT
jgi:hypothetical protein